MKNKYEARLGTERMLPLVFKMALPAVAAQFVNLLYNIVDRIYIGHIPEIGTKRFGWYRGDHLHRDLDLFFLRYRGSGRFTVSGYRSRAGRPGTGRKNSGKWIYIAYPIYYIHFPHHLYLHGTDPAFYRSIKIYVRICGGLSLYLFTGHSVCRDIHGLECLYQRTRASVYRYVLGFDRGFIEYRIRPYLHFLVGYGGKRRRARHDPIASLQCHMGIELPFLKTCLLAFGKAVYETGPKNRTLDVRFGNFSVHHGQYGESGGVRLE